MALDTNLWNAIKQESFYDKKKQNAAENMMLQEKMLQKQQQKEQQQLQLQESREIFLDQIQQTVNQFLPADAARIKQVEAQQRTAVYDAVKESGGDMKRFYMMGGHKILREYKNSIMNSEEVTKGLRNKSKMEQINTDFSKSKLFHDVVVDVTTESGVKEKRSVPIGEMLELFQDGYIDDLSYQGSEDAVKIDFTKFAKNYASRSPHRATRVTKDDMVFALQSMGQSPDIAQRAAEQYVVGEVNGEPVTAGFWGIKDYDYAKVNKLWGAGSSRSGTGAGGGKINTRWADTEQKVSQIMQTIPHLQKKGSYMSGKAMWENSQTGEIEEKYLGTYDADESIYRGLLKSLGVRIDAEGKIDDASFDVPMLLNITNGQGYQALQRHHYKLNSISKELIVVADAEDETKTQTMMEAEILIREDTMEDVLDWEDFWWETEKGKTAGLNWQDNRTGQKVIRDLSWEEEAQLKESGKIQDDATAMDDWSVMKVMIPLPNDEISVALQNKNIGYVQGGVQGEPEWQDFVSQQFYSSQGVAPTNRQGDINYGNVPQGVYVENQNDIQRNQAYQEALNAAMGNSQMTQYQAQLNAIQEQVASQNQNTGNQNNPVDLNPYTKVDIPKMLTNLSKTLSPEEIMLYTSFLKSRQQQY